VLLDLRSHLGGKGVCMLFGFQNSVRELSTLSSALSRCVGAYFSFLRLNRGVESCRCDCSRNKPTRMNWMQ